MTKITPDYWLRPITIHASWAGMSVRLFFRRDEAGRRVLVCYADALCCPSDQFARKASNALLAQREAQGGAQIVAVAEVTEEIRQELVDRVMGGLSAVAQARLLWRNSTRKRRCKLFPAGFGAMVRKSMAFYLAGHAKTVPEAMPQRAR